MHVTVLYVGSSLLAPLKNAEREINRDYKLDLRLTAHNFGSPLDHMQWSTVDKDLAMSDVVFIIHVMDGENAARLVPALERYREVHDAVIVINCMPELMRRTRMGSLDVSRFFGGGRSEEKPQKGTKERAFRLFGTAGSWIGRQTHSNGLTRNPTKRSHGQYLKLVDKLPNILKFVPTAGKLRDVKNYLYLFCYFLQPTPGNIRSMILFALKEYVPDGRLRKLKIDIPSPEAVPSAAIYHPDSPNLFETFESYRQWYSRRSPKSKVQSSKFKELALDAESTIGLLLMRPQVVSKTTKHYDELIHAIEREGLSVIPAISTLMDNREACQKFFIDNSSKLASRVQPKVETTDNGHLTTDKLQSRVSQILSLTGFSFVGGPAMNDSLAASSFLSDLNRPYRSVVSLDTQSIEAWQESPTGLNPIQAGMQVAIPEIDGAIEPFIYGGISSTNVEPAALEDRCQRLARRLRRTNRLRLAPRSELKLAMVLFCFPPNKGNIGTAADLDVFPSVWDTLGTLKAAGYDVEVPKSAEELRERLLGGNSDTFGATANVAYRMDVDEYHRLCPYVDEIESEWGRAPGRINSFGKQLLIQGIMLGKLFIGVQPTFGYEGDPMRLMLARGSAPHHGFMAFYTYLSQVLNVDAVIHVGTHGALEFMPGKQIGLSGKCWPDRLIGELPNIYLYSVNNPSEGSIAKRRSYAELVSYLTPPVENAGLYRELATLKELLMCYRQATSAREREMLFETIEDCSRSLNLTQDNHGHFQTLG